MPGLTIPLLASVVLAVMFLRIAHGNQVPNQPDPPSKASVGIKGYRRFHANDSLVGKSVLCTHKEKLCFRYNVLYFSQMDSCLHYAYYPCEFAGNKNEFLHGSGHLFATCPDYSDPCPGYRMAYDNRCYPKEMVRDVICGCDEEPTQHILGGMECRCSRRTAIHVQQPEEDGKCFIPDHLFPDERDSFRNSPLHSIEWDGKAILNCSADQARCFSMGKVWVEKGQDCFSLWERGPCPLEHLVVLDGKTALQGRAEGVCLHERGDCPQGQRRMAFDQRCYPDADLDVIRTGKLYLTEFGNHVVTHTHGSQRNVSLHVTDAKESNQVECLIKHVFTDKLATAYFPNPPCDKNTEDQKGCFIYEIETKVPEP